MTLSDATPHNRAALQVLHPTARNWVRRFPWASRPALVAPHPPVRDGRTNQRMHGVGVTSPFRAAARASARALSVVREHRAWARARRDARRIFHDDLGLRPGASLQDVVDAVAATRGRPLTLLRTPLMPPGVTGFAVEGATQDSIVVTTNVSARQGVHISLHELRHLCPTSHARRGPSPSGHDGFHRGTLQALTAEISTLPPAVLEEVLNTPTGLQAAHDDEEERDCELFATTVLPMLDLSADTRRASTIVSNHRSL